MLQEEGSHLAIVTHAQIIIITVLTINALSFAISARHAAVTKYCLKGFVQNKEEGGYL